jgi:hypothetical protein
MDALFAIAIELFPLILHLKPPLGRMENSYQQPRPIISLYRDLLRRHHASIGSSKIVSHDHDVVPMQGPGQISLCAVEAKHMV